MKYLPLIWAGLWRKPLRTILTLLSIVVAFVLFGVLQGVDAGLAHITEMQRLDRLFAVSRFGTPLPISYLGQIASLPGVTLVAPWDAMGGYWQDRKNRFGIVAVNDQTFAAYPELDVAKDEVQAFLRTRTGAMVSSACARKFGWKVGDKLPVTLNIAHQDGSNIWPFDVVSIFTMEGHEEDQFIVMNYDYLDEGRAKDKGTLNSYMLRINDPAQASQVSRAIDRLFISSAAPTRTFTERASGQSELNATFNATFFTKTVVGAAFFTLLLLTGNTMMQSVRERIPEFAVLRTLGFSDIGVLVIVVAESLLLTGVGAVLGLTIANFLMPLAQNTIGIAQIRPIVFLDGVGVAILVALASGLIPGWRAKRLNIVDALAGR